MRCELTHLAREPIDLGTARRQHDAYEQRLKEAGCSVVRLAADDEMPDSVFIEDIAIVFDELAVITRPGAASRRGETDAVADALAAYRPIVHIEAPGTIDGGDVLIVGKRVFVGESRRTNAAAISQLARHIAPHGYTVHIVPVRGCLHLKSAVTAVADDTLLINPEWVPAERFRPLTLLAVHPAEPVRRQRAPRRGRADLPDWVSPHLCASRGPRLARGRGGCQRDREGRRRGDVLQRDCHDRGLKQKCGSASW